MQHGNYRKEFRILVYAGLSFFQFVRRINANCGFSCANTINKTN